MVVKTGKMGYTKVVNFLGCSKDPVILNLHLRSWDSNIADWMSCPRP